MIDEIVVTWPDGIEEAVYNMPANQTIKLIEGQVISIDVEDPLGMPDHLDFTLFQPFPNPFNHETNLSFNLPLPGEVSLTVYNILGQEVLSENRNYAYAGKQSISLAGEKLGANGLYIYRLTWSNTVLSGVISKIN